jgi:hypothetical protein
VQYENNKQAKDAINRFDGNLAKGKFAYAMTIRKASRSPSRSSQCQVKLSTSGLMITNRVLLSRCRREAVTF